MEQKKIILFSVSFTLLTMRACKFKRFVVIYSLELGIRFLKGGIITALIPILKRKNLTTL